MSGTEALLPAREYELVVPVRLPEGMTPEEFLAHTIIEWNPVLAATSTAHGGYRVGRTLDEIPAFTGPRELRRAA